MHIYNNASRHVLSCRDGSSTNVTLEMNFELQGAYLISPFMLILHIFACLFILFCANAGNQRKRFCLTNYVFLYKTAQDLITLKLIINEYGFLVEPLTQSALLYISKCSPFIKFFLKFTLNLT